MNEYARTTKLYRKSVSIRVVIHANLCIQLQAE
jgi:hypothetical protein